MVISNNMIFKLSNADIIKLLDGKKLYKNIDNENLTKTDTNEQEIKTDNDSDDNDDNYGQYDYLLKMRFDLFTKKNVIKLKDQLNKKHKIHNDLTKLSIKELWINDLTNLKGKLT